MDSEVRGDLQRTVWKASCSFWRSDCWGEDLARVFCARILAASTHVGSLRVVSAWRGVLVMGSRTRQACLLEASKRLAGATVRLQKV